MANLGGLLMVALVVGLIGAAVLSYRKHTRAARGRSRAALSRLIAEAYEMQRIADVRSSDPPEEEPEAGRATS
jgi:hypothetical protein